MSLKEYLKSAALHFFIIVTLANVATFAVGMLFRPEEQFGYEAFLTPLIYGALGVLIIFLLVQVISWLLEVRQAEQMTAELLAWQKRRQ